MDHTGHDHSHMGHSDMMDMNAPGAKEVNHSMHSMHQMHMSFFFGQNVLILFDGWQTSEGWKYGLTLLGIFFWCILHEYLSTFRGKLEASIKAATKGKGNSSCMYGMNVTATKFLSTAVYLINVISSYFLMLIVMTFNAGIFIVLVLGLAVGYLLFTQPGSHYYSSEACCPA